MPARTAHSCPTHAARGFTLLELIISVALVLVLMLAITRIFTITSDAVGASQGLAAATRDARAAQSVFARDIGAMAGDSPFVWIKSEAPFSAWRNSVDELGDKDHLELTVDLNNDGREGDPAINGEVTPGFMLTARRHRLDCFSFMARDMFSRQTGNTAGNVLVSSLTSPEAWIYYGPTALPNNDGSFVRGGAGGRTDPGLGANAGENPNNYYANQWILGRIAPLMVRRSTTTNDIRDRFNVPQEFYTQISGNRMRPFTSDTPATTGGVQMRNARYDLIDVDMSLATDIVTAATATPGWYTLILNQHLEINPFVIKPIGAASTSQQVPAFVYGTSQFVVEFAGDFVEQDATGAVFDVNGNGTAYEPDGQIDYATVDGARQIRWYGYPRDVDGDGTIDVNLRDTNADSVLDTTGPDVVPVSDFALPDGTPYTAAANPYTRFEHFTTAADVSQKSYTATPNFGIYYAAFGPDSINNPANPRPKMYRITLVVDRPELAGRTPDGVTFEYVFNAP